MAKHSSHNNPDDYNMNYPEPPQTVFSSTPMDLGLSPDSYSPYSRPSHEYPTSMGYDSNSAIYSDAPYNVYSKSSPGLYPEDGPSSNLSIASASSSNMGSPLSNPGQLAPIPEWAAGAPQGLGVSPGIVDQNDYFPGGEYSFAPSVIEGFNPNFDLANGKGPGFVGELSQIPRCRISVSPRLHHASRGSISSSISSSESSSTLVVPNSNKSSLALDTRLARDSATAASPVAASAASSMVPSLVFASPATSASSFSPPPAWSSPSSLGGSSPTARVAEAQAPRLVSSFFSQSSGHFVPPLEASCWFSSCQNLLLFCIRNVRPFAANLVRHFFSL